MVDFRSGYVPPGVYVAADSSGSVGAVGTGATSICLVGQGLGYETYSEAVSFASGNTGPLSQMGINDGSVVVTDPTGATTYALTTDYTLATTGSGTAATTTISRVTNGAITSGATVQIGYQFADPNYYALNSFSDFATFQSVYGPPFDPDTGAILSPLSVGAQLAFQNGASVIYAQTVTGQSTIASQFEAALAAIGNSFDINIVVPLFYDALDGSRAQSYLTALETTLVAAEADGYPMLALAGLPAGFTGESPDVLAAQIAYRRIVLVWPQQFLYYNSAVNATQTLDGMYAAAAAAGVLASNAFNQGLTRSQVLSIAGIPAAVAQTMTTSAKNLWSSKGVAVFEIDRNGRLVIRHGVTTDVGSIQNREISIVREQDAIYDLIQVSLNQAALIGKPIISTTALNVKGIVATALETLLGNNTIQGYTNLLVRQQPLPDGDPSVIECTFDWQPTYPLNYISANFAIDLSTGAFTTTDTASSASASATS